jgi:ribA/ribD-fused uncharacterized protein
MQKTIEDFHAPGYEFLSNFYPCDVVHYGLRFGNAEAAFQASKCAYESDRFAFMPFNGAQAKRRGKRVALRRDWETVKVRVMKEVVREKFTQNPDLAAKLLSTESAVLCEKNTWHDTFWGVDMNGNGDNHLGKILMEIRDELRKCHQ